jgi:hypothetical protein
MKLECFVISEISWTQKDKFHMLSVMCREKNDLKVEEGALRKGPGREGEGGEERGMAGEG